MTPDELPDNASFGAIDKMIPETIIVDHNAYDKIIELIDRPAESSEALKYLFNRTNTFSSDKSSA